MTADTGRNTLYCSIVARQCSRTTGPVTHSDYLYPEQVKPVCDGQSLSAHADLGQEAILREHCAHARFVWNLAVEQQSWWRPGRGSAPGRRSGRGNSRRPVQPNRGYARVHRRCSSRRSATSTERWSRSSEGQPARQAAVPQAGGAIRDSSSVTRRSAG